MTKKEREELNNMVCGSSLYECDCHYRNLDLSLSPYQCWNRTHSVSPLANYLVYDGNIFRCSGREDCYRITPKTGKIRFREIDSLKQSILHRRIKSLKESPEFTALKLVRKGDKIWIDVNGREISPKWFQHSWWTFKWDCEDR